MRKLYLAYGANTNLGHMAVRCPTARYIANIPLAHHRLVFRGVADVEPHRNAKVECALWLIEPRDELALDRFEGFPSFYVKRYINIVVNGRTHRAMFYVMRNPRGRGQSLPPRGYEACLREGYEECGLPLKQIDAAIELARKFRAVHGVSEYIYRGSWARLDEVNDEAEESIVEQSFDFTTIEER
jgi:8-oxo-dGTP pyrophosphatase MutT (NUDIX family)